MLELRTSKVAGILLCGLEAITVGVLTTLAIFAIVALIMEVPAVVAPPFLGIEQLGGVLDHILGVFVLIELLATAVAYMRGGDIVRRIMEAMLVALARKLIGLDLATTSIDEAGALAILLVAVGLTWWLVWRTRRRAAARRSAAPSRGAARAAAGEG